MAPKFIIRRALLVQPSADTKVTRRILERRASEIAEMISCNRVEVEQGSVPKGNSWVFTFCQQRGARGSYSWYKVLELKVFGTRGQVYTALGNYLHGAEVMMAVLSDNGDIR